MGDQQAAKAKPEKVVPPSPPRVIQDEASGASFTRVGFLGEGGFARVWEVQDYKKRRKAVKVVYKPNIKSKKNKTKLWAEIKLHQMMQHPNIVRFDDCFEDADNVYMMLELCDNGSLMDLLRKRKRYTEPEARIILVQLIAACQYMHQTNVIHRDLKLGNLFFDKEMNVKVGDFGLAALIENPGDRKKTICGTPNYIAPEVLFDQANGHSFEVDVWSVGVILYTLLIGKPPFQTKDINAIYKRIKENRYEFPEDKEISSSAQQLIMAILNPNPQDRPTLEAILQHRWFHDGPFPPYVPVSAYDHVPSFEHLTTAQWRRNFESACHRARIGANHAIVTPASRRDDLGPSIIQQDKDFRYAVQPDSPVGALIQSARQPLVQAPAQIKEPTLLRKLSAAGAQSTLSPVRRAAAQYRSNGASSGPSGGARQMAPVGEEEEDEDEARGARRPAPAAHTDAEPRTRERELATQKARIVSQMAAMQLPTSDPAESDAASTDREVQHRYQTRSPRRPLASSNALNNQSSAPANRNGSTPSKPSKGKEREGLSKYPPVASAKQANHASGLFELVMEVLVEAMEAAETAEGYLPEEEILDAQAPSTFVVAWVDYCQKYGMGFAMCDGTISVHFNDYSNLAWSPSKTHVDYVSTNARTGQYERCNYELARPPSELRNKLFLLNHFGSYIKQRLYGAQPYLREDLALTTGMVFVKRFLRMKHVLIFRLSNGVLQFNFFDHSKLMVSHEGLVISYIDKTYALNTWSLEQVLRDWKHPGEDKAYVKLVNGVLNKLQYCKDVLVKIKVHGLSSSKLDTAGDIAGLPLDPAGSGRQTRSTAPSGALDKAAQSERGREYDGRITRVMRS